MMAGLVTWYNDVVTANQDPRTIGWFMVGSPFEGIVICLFYALFVTVIGPRWMKDREAMNIRNIMAVYNLAMVVLSSYMVYLFLIGGWATSYTFGCQQMDPSESPEAMAMVWACYLFYLSKYVEFLDTIFFILRKKFHLITFLHVFHHAIMPCSWWLGVKFMPGGMGTFHSLLNSFVHVCMYTYYGIAAMGPQYQKYIWWKKYMTKIQMTQFVLVGLHAGQMFVDTQCTYPKFFFYIIMAYSIIFLALFSNFYIQAYRKKLQISRRKSAASVTSSVPSSTSSNGAINGNAFISDAGDYNMNGEYKNAFVPNDSLNGTESNGLKQD